MRITDLLDVRSVSLDAAPKSKQEAIDAAVALMVKRVPPESEKELRFHMENVTRLTVRDLQQWLSGKVWILIP